MYKNILIPVVFDHSKSHADDVEIAQKLAGEGARITLLHVIEQLPAYVSTHIPDSATKRVQDELREDMNQMLQDIPGAEGKVIEGHSGRTIADYAAKNDVDLIIVKSHRPGLEDYFLGSTASHIVRHAACAVHVIR